MSDFLKTVSAYEGEEPYIFISYAHKDSEEVLPLIKALQDAGYNVWFDNGIQAGSEWPVYIERRLNDCSLVLAFISECAVSSRNCRNEINLALKLNKEMLVVHLEETVLRYGMELQLGSIQALYKYKQPSEETFVQNLIDAEALQFLRPEDQRVPGSVYGHTTSSEYWQSQQLPSGVPGVTAPLPSQQRPMEKNKRTQTVRYSTVAFSALAFIVGSLLMYFLTPLYNNATALKGLLITLGLIASVVLIIAIPSLVIKKKMKDYAVTEQRQIYNDFCAIVVLFGFLAIFVDSFLVNSTENVFFKILISVGINIARYFISMMFTPDDPDSKNS